jgi:L-fuconolactonase
MRIIDSHIHFWDYDPERHSWISEEMKVIQKSFHPQDALVNFERSGVEGCVAVQADVTEYETQYLADYAAAHPFIKGVVGWTDLKAPDLEERLHTYRQNQVIKGFREIMQGSPDERFLTNKDFHQGVGRLKDFGFTYDVLIYHDQLPAAIKFTEKFPDQPFILDHIAKPNIKSGEWKKWKEDIREIAKNPRMYCKVSGMVTESDYTNWTYKDMLPYLDIVAEFFGTDRLCYGSDWPVCLLAAQYDQALGIVTEFLKQVPDVEKEKVLSGNTSTFYNL